jgi:hypothetical protein
MTRLPAAALLLLVPFAGCTRAHTRELRFISAPGPASNALTITCQSSTTGKCYFLFTGSALLAEAAIRVGSTVTVAQLDPQTQFCSGIHKLNSDTCRKSPVEWHRVTIEQKTTTDEVAN